MRRLWYLFLLLPSMVFGALPFLPHFSWQPPTEYVSGDPLDPATDLAEYRLYCDGDTTPIQVVQAPATELVVPKGVFDPGTHTCHLTAVDIALQESDASNSVNFTVAADRPKAPVVFQIQ